MPKWTSSAKRNQLLISFFTWPSSIILVSITYKYIKCIPNWCGFVSLCSRFFMLTKNEDIEGNSKICYISWKNVSRTNPLRSHKSNKFCRPVLFHPRKCKIAIRHFDVLTLGLVPCVFHTVTTSLFNVHHAPFLSQKSNVTALLFVVSVTLGNRTPKYFLVRIFVRINHFLVWRFIQKMKYLGPLFFMRDSW